MREVFIYMTDIIKQILNDRKYYTIVEKYIPELFSISDDRELNRRASDLDFSDLLSLFDDLNALGEPKFSPVGIFLVCIDMETHLRINGLEKEMGLVNPDSFLNDHKNDFKKLLLGKIKIIKKGKEMYRSRKGCHDILFETNELIQNYHSYPYFGEGISNPPIHLATSERFNRSHYSYLYLASDINTAISETRPEVGEMCSVAKFEASKNLRLLDLTKNKKFEDIVLRSSTNGWKVYYFSQFISDMAKELKLDGIWYRSVQSNGKCAVIFNSNDFPFVPYSERLFTVKRNNLILEDLKEEKESTSFIVKGNEHFNDLSTRIHSDENVLNYIKSNNDANEMFDGDLFLKPFNK